MPVASMYRSTHLEIQLLSLPLRLEPGFVIHFSKHFPLTVCKINGNGKKVSAIAVNKRHQANSLLKYPMKLLRTYRPYLTTPEVWKGLTGPKLRWFMCLIRYIRRIYSYT